MPFIRVPIIGSGTRANPYRPALPPVAVRWSAHIPSFPDGQPRYSNAYVWVPQGVHGQLPPEVTRVPRDEAYTAIRQRDPDARPEAMEAD